MGVSLSVLCKNRSTLGRTHEICLPSNVSICTMVLMSFMSGHLAIQNKSQWNWFQPQFLFFVISNNLQKKKKKYLLLSTAHVCCKRENLLVLGFQKSKTILSTLLLRKTFVTDVIFISGPFK